MVSRKYTRGSNRDSQTEESVIVHKHRPLRRGPLYAAAAVAAAAREAWCSSSNTLGPSSTGWHLEPPTATPQPTQHCSFPCCCSYFKGSFRRNRNTSRCSRISYSSFQIALSRVYPSLWNHKVSRALVVPTRRLRAPLGYKAITGLRDPPDDNTTSASEYAMAFKEPFDFVWLPEVLAEKRLQLRAVEMRHENAP